MLKCIKDNFLIDKKIAYCICKDKCIENEAVKFNNKKDYIHVRIDDCVYNSSGPKRCDCIIINPNSKIKKIIIFIIERKTKSYDIKEEVIPQLAECITFIITKFNDIKYDKVIIPILYAKKHVSDAKRVFPSNPIRLGTSKYFINHLTYGENIESCIK